MNVRPEESALIRALLAKVSDPLAPDPHPMVMLAFESRLAEEAPPLGAHVFRLECELGGDAKKKVAAVTKERRTLRESLGKSRLDKGEGPAKIAPLAALTLNEYNAYDPFQKEDLRKAYDAEIERLKKDWPAWSCGAVDTLISRPDVTHKCKKCKGTGMKLPKGAPTTKSCGVCKGTKLVGAPPLLNREGGRKRAVVVTRFSSVRPDEESVDATLGGKIPVDRLVQAGVLRGDTHVWLVRYGSWVPCLRGEGRVVVDVYEIALAD